MPRIPDILDVRTDLEQAQETSDQDIGDDIDDVLDLIRTYEDRDYGSRQSLLDQIDEELLRLEEQAESDHTRLHVQAARNRIRLYRDAMSESATDFGILATELTADEDERATLQVTVVNSGEPRTVDVVVTFYDEDFEELETTRSDPIECGSNAEETVEMDVVLPDDYAHYVPAVREET